MTWKTYFVFFCFNVAFVPIKWLPTLSPNARRFLRPRTNGYKLEEPGAIFAEAHAKGKNPVFTERRYRESGGKPIAIANSSDGDGVQDEKEKENDVVEDV
ncbi:hypothetical protein LTS10_006494 [Elasticomyces elasticus]|nr:hypothetical protein LTS10_006494 [Elasticomyces elasticus]